MGIFNKFFGNSPLEQVSKINKQIEGNTVKIDNLSNKLNDQLELLNQQNLNQVPERLNDFLKLIKTEENQVKDL